MLNYKLIMDSLGQSPVLFMVMFQLALDHALVLTSVI